MPDQRRAQSYLALLNEYDVYHLRRVSWGEEPPDGLSGPARMLVHSDNGHTSSEALAGNLQRLNDRELDTALAQGDQNTPEPEPSWIEPEDRGQAVLSETGSIEYVEDLGIRPGRIVVWAAEEGSGKSYAVDDELGIRIAVAGGSFAGTWPVLQTGPFVYLSEMHTDDDYEREEITLQSLGLSRSDLTGRFYRLPLLTAAGGPPVLSVPEWRTRMVEWMRARGALVLTFDTATGASEVKPWGSEILQVYRDLRMMLAAYPAMAIILIVHCKKPDGRGERRISDVIGEWGRWCDVVVMQENDGTSRVKLSTHKRVRKLRRIVATKSDGLLIEPKDITSGSEAKVAPDKVLAAITHEPGLSTTRLGKVLGVSTPTASGYVKTLEQAGQVMTTKGTKNSTLVYPVGWEADQ